MSKLVPNIPSLPYKLYSFDEEYIGEIGAFEGDITGIIVCDREKAWLQNGLYHRIDGPACVMKDGTKEWYIKDEYHRIGGYAIEYPNGINGEYWINGKHITKKQHDLFIDIMKLKGLL